MKPRVIVGLALIFGALIAIVAFTISGNASLEVKVDELLRQQRSGVDLSQKVFKLTGSVVGDCIRYDAKTLNPQFDIVQERGTVANRLATTPDTDTQAIEASAIITGKIAGNSKFSAGSSPDSCLPKC